MKHILLVEPDESVGNILSHYLSADKKWTVAVARNAQDAIHAADEKRPDLIILELAIPMHNGFSLAKLKSSVNNALSS